MNSFIQFLLCLLLFVKCDSFVLNSNRPVSLVSSSYPHQRSVIGTGKPRQRRQNQSHHLSFTLSRSKPNVIHRDIFISTTPHFISKNFILPSMDNNITTQWSYHAAKNMTRQHPTTTVTATTLLCLSFLFSIYGSITKKIKPLVVSCILLYASCRFKMFFPSVSRFCLILVRQFLLCKYWQIIDFIQYIHNFCKLIKKQEFCVISSFPI